MKKKLRKLTKGLFAIFLIKLLFFGGALIIHSCHNDDDLLQHSDKQIALEEFERTVMNTVPQIESILDKKQPLLNAKNYGNNEIITLSEKEIKKSFQPLISGSKKLFYSYNINDNDFNDILEEKETIILALLGLTVLAIENENNTDYANISSLYSIMGIQTVNAQSWSEIGSCAAGVLSLNALDTLKNALLGKKITKKALMKALKIAARKFGKAITGWGGLIMLAEFSICIGLIAIANA